jgi:hypothetical protein
MKIRMQYDSIVVVVTKFGCSCISHLIEHVIFIGLLTETYAEIFKLVMPSR